MWYYVLVVLSYLSEPLYLFARLLGERVWDRAIMLSYNLFSRLYDRTVAAIPGYNKLAGLALGLAEGDLLLDVACGTGFFSILALRRGFEVVGVDISVGQIRVLREKEWRVHVVVADAKMLPLRSRAFDVAASFGAFPELSGPGRVAGEMARVVREGGRIVVAGFRARGLVGWPLEAFLGFLRGSCSVEYVRAPPLYFLAVGLCGRRGGC